MLRDLHRHHAVARRFECSHCALIISSGLSGFLAHSFVAEENELQVAGVRETRGRCETLFKG